MFPVRFKQILSVASLIALAGCGGHSVSAMPLSQSVSRVANPATATVVDFSADSASPDTGSQLVGVRLNGEAPFMSSRYGRVLGYFRGVTSTTSQVVMLTAATAVHFKNVDASFPHTASFLGNATKNSAPFPPSFNGSSTQSAAGTPIGTTNFSTGALNPGQKSLKYTTGPPGFYMIGCAFHYNSFGMRSVIVVQ